MSVPTVPPGVLTIDRASEPNVATLTLAGELDIASGPALEAHLSAIEDERPTRILIDLGRLQFIDSTGLRILLQANARAAAGPHELVLRALSPPVQRVFETTGVLHAFQFESAPAA
jgi:anti-anti-sigma factor